MAELDQGVHFSEGAAIGEGGASLGQGRLEIASFGGQRAGCIEQD